MEKDLRTRVQVMLKQKRDRQQELKALQEQDRDLCDILCVSPFGIDSNAVPSLEELDHYRRHLASLSAEKVSGGRARSPWGGVGTVPTGFSRGSSPAGAKARGVCQYQAASHPLHGGAGPHPGHEL